MRHGNLRRKSVGLICDHFGLTLAQLPVSIIPYHYHGHPITIVYGEYIYTEYYWMGFRNQLTNHYHRASYFGGSEAPVLLGKITLPLGSHRRQGLWEHPSLRKTRRVFATFGDKKYQMFHRRFWSPIDGVVTPMINAVEHCSQLFTSSTPSVARCPAKTQAKNTAVCAVGRALKINGLSMDLPAIGVSCKLSLESLNSRKKSTALGARVQHQAMSRLSGAEVTRWLSCSPFFGWLHVDPHLWVPRKACRHGIATTTWMKWDGEA